MPDNLPQLLFGRDGLQANLSQIALKNSDGTLKHPNQQFFFTRTVAIQGDPGYPQALGDCFERRCAVALLAETVCRGLQDGLFAQGPGASVLCRHALRLLDSLRPCKRPYGEVDRLCFQ